MFDAIDSGQLRHAVWSGFCDMLIVSIPRSLATGVGSIDLPSSLTGIKDTFIKDEDIKDIKQFTILYQGPKVRYKAVYHSLSRS